MDHMQDQFVIHSDGVGASSMIIASSKRMGGGSGIIYNCENLQSKRAKKFDCREFKEVTSDSEEEIVVLESSVVVRNPEFLDLQLGAFQANAPFQMFNSEPYFMGNSDSESLFSGTSDYSRVDPFRESSTHIQRVNPEDEENADGLHILNFMQEMNSSQPFYGTIDAAKSPTEELDESYYIAKELVLDALWQSQQLYAAEDYIIESDNESLICIIDGNDLCTSAELSSQDESEFELISEEPTSQDREFLYFDYESDLAQENSDLDSSLTLDCEIPRALCDPIY